MERVTGGCSIHEAEKDIGPHDHRWRTVKCDGVRDICECAACGRQQEFGCNFDDEYS